MPKLDIEKEYEAIKTIEDVLYDEYYSHTSDRWEIAKEILIYLKVRGFEVVKKDR